MNRHKSLIAFFLLLTGTISLALVSCDVYAAAVVWTDKPDYAPWETVTIYGSGFNPNTNIDIAITRPDLVVEAHSTMSDASGYFVYYYVLNGMEGTYTVTATDGTNSATTTFTEAVHVDFRQYANKVDKWINSILQSSNSIYYECMSVPQRVIFVDVASTSGNVHTLTLSHMATKGGLHAYDWLTGWNQGNVPPLGYTPWGDEIGPHATTAICQALHLKTAPYEIYVNVPDDPFISKDGSTQVRINAYEAAWGNRQIRICGNQPITSAGFSAMSHNVANGGDTGDSYILYTLTWTSASDQILIELAGHLALSGDPVINPIAWGVGLGSSQVAGGPYHFKLGKLDGASLGSQDNQIMGADILVPPGHIIVHKTTVPAGDPADFTFDPDYQVSNFVLSDGEQYDSGAVVSGTYHVQELALAGWDLTGLTVTDPSGGSSTDLGTGKATIGLAAGETVHVYFTNTKRGKIIVDKITVPAADPQSFTFTTTGSGYSGFSLTDGAAPNDSGWLVPGTYTVTETVPVGWSLTSVTKNGADFTNGGNIVLGAGEIVYVNFTNTKRGKIIVDKITVPAADPQSFSFSASGPNGYSASFSLTDAQTPWDSGWLKPGSGYAVTETVPAAWVLTSAVCSDGSPVNNIVLDPGETVIVAFTDERTLPGKASLGNFVWEDLNRDGVQDPLEPGVSGVTVRLYWSDGTFVGSTTTDGSGYFSFTDLDPGDYYLVFTLPSGYVFAPQDQGADDSVDSDVDPSTGRTMIISLQAGENDPSWDAGLIKAPVGGVWVPIEKFHLLAQWIGWASFVMASTIFVACINRKKRRQN